MTKHLAALLALPLAGCISFSAKPPPALMTLTPVTTVTAGTTRIATIGKSISIAVPGSPAVIAGNRVPVYGTNAELAYLKNTLWADSPSRLFQRLLSETVSARTGRLVLDARQFGDEPGTHVVGTLQNFGVLESGPTAVVTYDAIISKGADQVETRRFESRVKFAAINSQEAVMAINQAANDVAAQVADWLGK